MHCFLSVTAQDTETLLDIKHCPALHIDPHPPRLPPPPPRPPNGAITYCSMMEEHVSFPAWDTLTGLLVEFTVKACVGQLRIVHTAKNIQLIASFGV